MSYKNKKVLVTGASGFIGTALCKVLLKEGAFVIGFARKFDKTMHKELLDNTKFKSYESDILEINKFEKIIKEQEIIFHLAAQPSVFYSNKHPLEDFKTNVLGTVMLLDIIKESKTRLVYPSSISVYDGRKNGKYKENEACATSFYALSKLTCEGYIKRFCMFYGLNATVLRLGYVFGEGMTRGPIFDIFQPLIKGKDKIVLYSNPQSKIDFIYIEDVICALLSIAENKKLKGEVINISMGRGVSMIELIKEISLLFNKKDIKIGLHEDAKKTKKCLVADNSKAKSLLGWKPRYNLRDGLKECYTDYHK